MQFAFGVLHLTPDVFWKMTLRELCAAFRGYQNSKGMKPANNRYLSEDEMTSEQHRQLADARLEADLMMKKRKANHG